MSERTTKVVTGKNVRFSYAHVFEPKAMSEGDKEKYSVCLLIPKSDKVTVDKIKAAIAVALEDGKAKYGGKIPTTYKQPLRDGDAEREDDENYKGMYFVNASSNTKPGIVDANVNEIIDKEQFYSGCYGRASVNFYAFNTNGNKGVACGLNNVQKCADGPKLAGGSSAEEDFGSEADDLM